MKCNGRINQWLLIYLFDVMSGSIASGTRFRIATELRSCRLTEVDSIPSAY